MKKEASYKAIYLTFGILVICLAIASYAIAQWTEPSASPPAGNVALPLNVSNVGQSKAGGLILNTGGAANGLIVDQGNVGIGTSFPSRELHVYGSGTQGLRVESSNGQAEISVMSNSAGPWYMYSPGGSNDLRFFDTTDRVTFQSGGNVGIGETIPTAKLHIGGVPGTDGIKFPDGTLQTTAVAGGNFQTRVSGTCTVGSSIRAINADGTVVCETDDAPVTGTVVGGGYCAEESPNNFWGTGFCSGDNPACSASGTVRITGRFFSGGNIYYFICVRN